ncbi:hypothetical protein HPB50_020805 [Hyalomma asiaticum]|uniref:Uncharacterized protein n=1 Tax=Hyalomma asiaticum TaxID=266040 RepID=A0ACB7RT48_HYAAI|nr:hypothetical protein HPB50_020805 [Hyalomma asiaticum]
MVATRADRLRFPAHWDDSETCAVVEDSAVSCSSATDLPGATPMTAYHYRHHLSYPRSSSSSSLHPKSPSRQQRRLSRLQQQRGLVSRAGDLVQECRGRGDFLSGRQRQRLPSPLQSQHREDFAATSWIGWPRTTRSSSWWTGTTTPTPCYRRTSTARRPGCVPSLLLLVLLFLLQQPLLVLGSGVFELRLGSFSNPSNRDSHGSCCSTGLPPATEGTPCPGSPCRVSFRVCLKHYQKTVDTDSPCTYGELSTPVLVQSESDGAIFNASRPPIRVPSLSSSKRGTRDPHRPARRMVMILRDDVSAKENSSCGALDQSA